VRFGAAASHGATTPMWMSWTGLIGQHCSGNPAAARVAAAHGVRTVGQSDITVWKMTDNVVETLGDLN
jgi:hypothetical protein